MTPAKRLMDLILALLLSALLAVPFVLFLIRLLARCVSPAETDAVYARRCVPRKARIDLIYQRRRNICYDLVLMARSLLRALGH